VLPKARRDDVSRWLRREVLLAAVHRMLRKGRGLELSDLARDGAQSLHDFLHEIEISFAAKHQVLIAKRGDENDRR